MKSYTDIEQSKKLAEILPIESADMWWSKNFIYYNPTAAIGISAEYSNVYTYKFGEDDIPCWSLAALLGVIKPINENTYTIIGTLDGGAVISFDEVTSVMYQEKEIIDAVFEMVVWLKEIGKL